jgi:hypothetical protein
MKISEANMQITLVDRGTASSVIVLGQAASPSEKRGAQELQTHLRLISGATIPIVSDRQELPPQAAILVGRSRHTEALAVHPDLETLGPEGFILKTLGNRLVVASGPVRGTMYGCTALLEKLGVRWFTPSVTRHPQSRTLTLPVLDETHVPAFEYREPFIFEAFDKDWAARMKVNGFRANLDDSTGGQVTYHPFVHTLGQIVPGELFDAHPEYFPLIDGRRANEGYVQRCLSHPDVLRMAIEQVRRWFTERPDAMISSVSQNDTDDTGGFCRCPECTAIADRYGGKQSGLFLWFVNQVAEAIEAEFPDKLIDTLAYRYTESPPEGIVPRPNVRVRLCPISCCELHPYEQCSHKSNVAFMENLKGWGRLTNSLYIWHYCTNFAHYLAPFPDFRQFPASARLYRRTGVKGIFFQGAYAEGGGGSDAELRAYVMARLLWNPDEDADALVTEWMQGVYGPVAEPMRRWFDRMHEQGRDPDKHLGIYDPPDERLFSDAILADGDRLFDKAERLAQGDEVAARYVEKSRLCLRYVKLARHPTDGPEFRQWMADVRRWGITQLREGSDLDKWEQAYLEKMRADKPLA